MTTPSEDQPAAPLRVAHVTECLGGGLLTSIVDLTRRQREEGMAVTVVFARNGDTPPPDVLTRLFAPGVELIEAPASATSAKSRFSWIMRRVRFDLPGRSDVIHLHSSIAGAIGRVALLGVRRGPRVFYSPHGFSYLRLDKSAVLRRAFGLTERLLARTRADLVLVSDSEADSALDVVHPRECFVIRNGVSLDELPVRIHGVAPARPLIVMVGRIVYQKAPWQFARVAKEIGDAARFVWVGDGDDVAQRTVLEDAGVEITGWLGRDETRKLVASSDILLFLTLWEGMPLALLEAQAMGVPTVASRIIGNVDVVRDGETGVLVSSVDEAIATVRRLVEDPEELERLSVNALALREGEWTNDAVGRQSAMLYSGQLPAYRAQRLTIPTTLKAEDQGEGRGITGVA